MKIKQINKKLKLFERNFEPKPKLHLTIHNNVDLIH